MARAVVAVAGGCGAGAGETTGTTTSAIQGGAEDTTHDFAVAVLVDLGGGAGDLCSGALLAPNLVATARHCVAPLSSSQVDCATTKFGATYAPTAVRVSDAAVLADGGAAIGVRSIVVPSGPGEDQVCGDDLALLVLASSISLPAYVTPVLDPPMTDHAVWATSIAAIGYGDDSAVDASSDGTRRIRQGIELVCIPNDATFTDCYADPANKSVLTAGEFESGDGTCSGDSGSSAFDEGQFGAGRWMSFGVLSRGDAAPDGATCAGAVYTRFDAWAPLILATAKSAAAAGGYTPPAWTSGRTMPPPSSGAGGCSVGVAGGDSARVQSSALPTQPVPWFAAIAVALGFGARRRRRAERHLSDSGHAEARAIAPPKRPGAFARYLLNSRGMNPAMRPATARELHQRARFEALRTRIFDELGRGAARWRLTWILPYNVFVVALLVARGESGTRAILQAIAVIIIGATFVARVFWDGRILKMGSLFIGMGCYFLLLGTTGGIASPLLMTGAVMMSSAAMTIVDPPWLRRSVFLVFFVAFVSLALLSRTAVGELAPPIGGGLASPVFVVLSTLASLFAMAGVYRMGCWMTHGYERAALELAERREELCSAGEDRTRALEGMAARLAHEVKNPLAAIKGLSVHMARNAPDPKTAERLAIVAAEADRLQGIVEGFLSFSRGLDDLVVSPTKPHEVARELGVLLEMRGEEAGVKLEVVGDAGLVVDADSRKLRQALLNIVLNAIQASPRGATVRIGVDRVCEGARVTVHDDGTGMTPEVLERIRKPYFTTREGGTGLGVAVARGLVEQHGGRLEFKSVPGTGTTVTITLPMKARCERLPNPVRSEKIEAAPAGAR
jgi:MYXO-CTERM domain-containing protein